MGWQITLGAQHVLVDDLPGKVVGTIARKHDLSWLDLYLFPARDVEAFVDLVREVSTILGVAMPPHSSVAEVVALTDTITRVDDDLPTKWHKETGLPLGEGETETTSSSISPDATNGLPTSSDANPSETSDSW